jgi:hypothetical protein
VVSAVVPGPTTSPTAVTTTTTTTNTNTASTANAPSVKSQYVDNKPTVSAIRKMKRPALVEFCTYLMSVPGVVDTVLLEGSVAVLKGFCLRNYSTYLLQSRNSQC